MDNKKIGKFISLLRKEKNMTQSDLANELFVTDKAVSRWERGIGLPDITILHSLSCILGVSIEELLNGEKNNLSTDNLELIKIRKKNKKLKRIICTLLIIFILIGIFIFIKYKYRFDITVKEDYSLILTSNYKDICNSQMDLLYEDETKRIYSYCVPKVTIMNNKTKELISFKDLDKNKSDEIFENIFYDKNLFNSVNNSFVFQDENTNILVYNSFDSTGSKIINIYIGSDNLNRRNYFSNYESEFTRTYKVLGKSIIDNTLYLSLSSTKSRTSYV
jgi:transcriptional regulator with XRE-family HTH domain